MEPSRPRRARPIDLTDLVRPGWRQRLRAAWLRARRREAERSLADCGRWPVARRVVDLPPR